MSTFSLFFSAFVLILITANWKHKASQKYFALDRAYTNVLRGIAMVMIMLGHVGGVYGESVWFTPLPAIGVALFLMLSGYGNNESYLKKKEWRLVKLLRIALPYWLIAIPLYVINGVTDWTGFVLNLSFVRINSVYWFVGYIMQWYVVYWLSINYAYKYRWLLFCLFSIISLLFLPGLQTEQAMSFPCGVWLSEHKNFMFAKSRKWLTTVACTLFIVATTALAFKQTALVRSHMEYASYVDFFIKLPYALVVVITLRYLNIFTNHHLLTFVGGITLELYLVHMQCLVVIETSNPATVARTTLLFFAISFAGAWILKKLNDKVLHSVGLQTSQGKS